MRIRSLFVLAGAAALTFPAASAARSDTVVNTSFAGYSLNATAESSLKDTATFVVPKLKCGHTDAAFWANIGFANDAGTSTAGLFMGCKGGKEHVYRARLLNFSPQEAQGACSALHKKKIECSVVPPPSAKVAIR